MTSEERISFHILENALYYVLSAAEYAKFRSPRSWKYSILHLVAGIELLIKSRLQNEHWSLLFQNVDRASEDELESGRFISVDFNTACNRLKNIAGIDIAKSDLIYLEQLRDIRNRIQHFAIDIDITQVRALVAKGISFFLGFSEANMDEHISAIGRPLERIHRHLRDFEEFVESRMTEIKAQLQGAQDLIECRVCWQRTLIVGNGDPHCPFCGFTATAQQLANTLGEGPLDEECLACGAETMCFILYNNDFGVGYCTTCGTSDSVCQNCRRRFIGKSEYCPDCEAKESA